MEGRRLTRVHVARPGARAQVAPGKLGAPGFDPSSPFSSRLSARSALYTELHLLLSSIDVRCPTAGFRGLVIDDNLLARTTTSGRTKLWQELKARYRLDADDPLFAAFLSEWRRSSSEAERALTAYILCAANDRLVTVLGTEWLFSLLRRAPAEIRVADVQAFVLHERATHPEVGSWSEKTRLAVAQKYCASIRDFGLAAGTTRKVTLRPALYGAPMRLLVRALRLAGVSPLALVRAPAFRLLGVDTAEVIDALGEMNRIGALRFRMQADIVELDVEP
jgi:hypothetical protein